MQCITDIMKLVGPTVVYGPGNVFTMPLHYGSPCRIELIKERLELVDSILAVGPRVCPIAFRDDGIKT